jgi:superfamily I DNA/RNA helicase
LEFKVVFLIGVESMPRFADDEEYERRLAYVALTRAQDILHIPYETDSGYVTELKEIVSGHPEKN